MGALLMRARRSQENPTRKTPASCRPAGEPEDDDLSGDGQGRTYSVIAYWIPIGVLQCKVAHLMRARIEIT